jgi:CheY-like chemotaxis protein
MILVVDDIADSCDIMSRHLRREGYSTRCATSAAEAWSILQSGGDVPQLVILDVMMPQTDGRALLRDLRTDDRLKDIPVLVCTADSSYARMSELLSLGANGYLIKGLFDRECFLRSVEHYAGPPRAPTLTLTLNGPSGAGAAPVTT